MPINESFKKDIEEGQRLRGWIANAYAQIEFLLGDLLLRCREFPEYAAETASFTHSAPKRVRQVRKMLEKEGRLTSFAAELTSIIDRFEERHETRNLLAHGFCEYLVTPTGDAALHVSSSDCISTSDGKPGPMRRNHELRPGFRSKTGRRTMSERNVRTLSEPPSMISIVSMVGAAGFEPAT
jgi:hypothetical protein